MALGLSAMLLGIECFVIERIELSPSFTSILSGRSTVVQAVGSDFNRSSVFQNSAYQFPVGNDGASAGPGRIFRPREWMPWSFLAIGAIIVMYTSAYAKKPA
jgi:hypothetical protein